MSEINYNEEISLWDTPQGVTRSLLCGSNQFCGSIEDIIAFYRTLRPLPHQGQSYLLYYM